MDEKLEKKTDAPVPGKTTVMSEEKIYNLCIKGTKSEKAIAIFTYLRQWRRDSNYKNFGFWAA